MKFVRLAAPGHKKGKEGEGKKKECHSGRKRRARTDSSAHVFPADANFASTGVKGSRREGERGRGGGKKKIWPPGAGGRKKKKI